MKTIRFKFLMLMWGLGLVFSIASQAADEFTYNGLKYRIISEKDRTVEITYESLDDIGNMYYVQGHVSIPPKAIYNSKSYSVIRIDDRAFYRCRNLKSVEIPSSVTTIGSKAFSGCDGLTSVEIPSSVTIIGEYAFDDCINLAAINIQQNNPVYISLDGTLYSKENGIATSLIRCPRGKKGNFKIPNSVTTIGSNALSGCDGLTSVEIPNSVTIIGEYAFSSCDGLTSVTIPNSVTTIGYGAFSSCGGLTSVEISNSVTIIGEYAFSWCTGLISVDISNSVTTIGEGTFQYCFSLTSVTIPNSVTNIGKEAFMLCTALTSVDISNSVTTIGSDAFSSCSGLTSVEIPSSVTTIGSGAFSNCSGLTSVTIPNSVTTIGYEAFSSCGGLTSVEIPSSVKAIGGYAFTGIRNVAKIYCHWEKPIEENKNDILFSDDLLAHGTLYVPIGTKANYEKVDPWRNFFNIVEGDYNASSGITDVVDSDKSTLYEIDRFDVNGKPVSKDYKGLVIIRYSDGSTLKTIIK